ncbi:MAG TPA: DUF4349 domain-containing protein [Candidatus Moranbacteria bacterium]|nr:DUF4349 domain-containing protein [Candidatus Moranbacteria bacterium]HRZ33905.1 DUF4349 domain-containing protein [Candidatus Moranbacteria bacterium]
MNKFLKIGGILLGILIVLFVAAIVLRASKSILSGSSSFSNETSRSSALGLPSAKLGFSNQSPAASMKNSSSPSSYSIPSESSYDAVESGDFLQADKKIIKNGDLELKVKSAEETAEKISEIAKDNGGEIFSSNFYQSAKSIKSGTITIKVPVANFEKTFSEIKKVSSLVIRESISGQDVTEQYVDLKAQLTNRQAEEQSYIKILGQAQKIDDVLAVTQQLSRVRGTIEQIQGKIKYLDSQTDMSTISANLTEDENITIADSWRPWQVVKESFNSLIKVMQGLVDFVIRLIIVVVPFLLVWVLIIWGIYRVGKKIYLKIKNRN